MLDIYKIKVKEMFQYAAITAFNVWIFARKYKGEKLGEPDLK